MEFIIREIEQKDDLAVEKVIRDCLIEFGADHEGTAWADPDLCRFSEIYNSEGNKYWVAEDENGNIAGGVGIGELKDAAGVCELQKMYCIPEVRGTGVAHKLMQKALEYAPLYYDRCYLETLDNMIAAQKFYEKYGFTRTYEPIAQTEHYACEIRYIKEIKAMKKIVLIGDSIRMGYDKYVKEALQDTAEVYYPDENCRYAENVLRFAHDWKNKGKWPTDVDLVHWNAGLWDVLELFGDGPLTSLAYYEEAIARIYKRLRMLFPKAKIVFATSTAVLEERCSADFRRHNAIIDKYNKAAVNVLKNTDTVINDLYALTVNCPPDYHSDAVHFYTDKGTEIIGGRVISVICRELDIASAKVNIENFQPEKYLSSNIGY